MQRLNRGMMDRYDIPVRYPSAVNAVQFGMDETLLGTVDRLIDDAGADIGIACVQVGEAGLARQLAEQDCLYTLLERGYRDETAVRREQVVQCVLQAIDPEADFDALIALAGTPALALGLLNASSDGAGIAFALAARLLAARRAAGLGGLAFICVGESDACAAQTRAAVGEIAASWGLGADFSRWLDEDNAFFPALADSLVFRADPAEAAKLCAEMNYEDALIHIAEPFAGLIVQAPEDFRRRWPLDGAAGARFTDSLAPEIALKHRIFDAGLFAMAAPGWLLGCDTLSDCMKHGRLRACVGRAFYDEILPSLGMSREAAAPRVIEAFERYENPLNRNAILGASHHLLRRFRLGALPVIREWASDCFEPPRYLTFALAATIMLYAGARKNGDGVWEVARGRQRQAIVDDPGILEVFSTLAHDMPPETLAYAALADRELWRGEDLRRIEGLESRVALDIAAIQRDPAHLPEAEPGE